MLAEAFRRHGRVEHLIRGDVLLRDGDRADSVHLVASGRFHVVIRGQVVAEVAAGEPLGEIAFLSAGPRTADVVAARDSSVLTLDRTSWGAALAEAPSLGAAMMGFLARRLAATAPFAPPLVPQAPRMLTLMPAGGCAVPVGLADALARGITDRSPLRPADRPGDAGDARALAAWLQRIEGEGHRRIVLIEGRGTAAPDDWALAALRQSDAVVLVGRLDRRTSGIVSLTPLEEEALRLHRPQARHLVLTRGASRPVAGTADWLSRRDVRLHHHVRDGDRASLDRAARLVRGTGLGLVLSGGGALSCAHQGVLRALREGGVEIDMMGGTSGGGAMAIAAGSGMEPAEILDRTKDIFVRSGALRRVTVPIHAILDHHLFDAKLREHFGDRLLEDFERPAFAVSASLTYNAAHVHRGGPAWAVARATGSLPGLLPPVVRPNGEVLVDGAVVDNLPVGPMHDRKMGPNLVVGLLPPVDWRVERSYDALPRRGALLRDLALRRYDPHDFPRVIPLMQRALALTSRQAMRAARMDGNALIRPRLPPGSGLMDWSHADRLAEAGYRHACRVLDEAGSVGALLAHGGEAMPG